MREKNGCSRGSDSGGLDQPVGICSGGPGFGILTVSWRIIVKETGNYICYVMGRCTVKVYLSFHEYLVKGINISSWLCV